jgi:hypothetical protein
MDEINMNTTRTFNTVVFGFVRAPGKNVLAGLAAIPLTH